MRKAWLIGAFCWKRQDSSPVTTLAVSPENAFSAGVLLIAYRSLSLVFYSTGDYSPLRSVYRAHDAPITVSIADPTGSLFATGSADGIVKVWDGTRGHCTHVFRGHGGVVSALSFDVHPSRPPRLFSASDDCKIRGWDLSTRKSMFTLDGHSSVVRGLAVTQDGSALISGGRDKVLNVWHLPSGALKHTIPVFETLEAVGLIDIPAESDIEIQSEKRLKGKRKLETFNAKTCVWTAGDTGQIRLWDLQAGQALPLSITSSTSGKKHEIVHVW